MSERPSVRGSTLACAEGNFLLFWFPFCEMFRPHPLCCTLREVLDGFLRERAEKNGATVINGLFLRMDVPSDETSPYVIHYTDYSGGGKVDGRLFLKGTYHSSMWISVLSLGWCCKNYGS